MSNVAVCTTVFKRINKMDKLLNSIDSEIVSTVYVADDGEWTDQKEKVYSQSFGFDLKVFNLDFDSGLGAGRHKIAQEFDEDYLLLMDSDMKMPKNTEILLKQLQNNSKIGGICGLFAEDKKIFSSGCLDIYIEDDVVELDIRESKEVEFLEGYPFIEFDMIANGALFRQECIKEYSWDPEYVIGREHADFYIGHKKRTDWKFGLCPSVHFPHHPGGDEDYLSHRWDDRKYREAEEYLLDKWGFSEYNQMDDNWIDVYNPHFGKHSNPNLIDMIKFKYKSDGLVNFFAGVFKFVKNRFAFE